MAREIEEHPDSLECPVEKETEVDLEHEENPAGGENPEPQEAPAHPDSEETRVIVVKTEFPEPPETEVMTVLSVRKEMLDFPDEVDNQESVVSQDLPADLEWLEPRETEEKMELMQ